MSSVEQNKQVVLQMINALSSGNLEEMLSYLNDDATWEVPLASDSIPGLKGPKTKAAFEQQCRGFRTIVPDGVKMTVKAVTAEEDRVAVEAEVEAVTCKGQNYNNKYHFLFRMKNGKIQSAMEYCDLLLVMETLGWAFEV